MKAFTQLIGLVAAAASASALVVPEIRAEQDECVSQSRTVPLLRGYQPSTIDHFYTTDVPEMENAIVNLGYRSEGDAGFIFPTQVASTTPLYRTYSPGTVDHFYTASLEEKDYAVAQSHGYGDEGITGYIYATQICDSAPLYRAYSPTGRDHFYTMSKDEKNNAVTSLGYVDEGIVGYIFPA